MANKKEPLKQSDIKLLHPLLGKIAQGVIDDLKKQDIDARIIETGRTPERQQWLFNRKKSKTLKSKHLGDNARAFDIGIFDEKGNYVTDSQAYVPIGKSLENIGVRKNVTWGGDWGWDWGHIEKDDILPKQ